MLLLLRQEEGGSQYRLLFHLLLELEANSFLTPTVLYGTAPHSHTLERILFDRTQDNRLQQEKPARADTEQGAEMLFHLN